MKYDSTPLTGGPPPIGLQASITGLPSIASAPASFKRVERCLAGHRQHDEIAERGGLRERLHLSARILRRPFLELRRVAGAHRDLVPVLEEPRAERLRDHARTDDADFHLMSPCAAWTGRRCYTGPGKAQAAGGA